MKLSYDYTYLINRLKGEIELHGLKLTDEVAVERGDQLKGFDYRPIVGWYFKGDYPDGLPLMIIGNLLIEMEKMNAII